MRVPASPRCFFTSSTSTSGATGFSMNTSTGSHPSSGPMLNGGFWFTELTTMMGICLAAL